jgi:hypothetical protein
LGIEDITIGYFIQYEIGYLVKYPVSFSS